jgi:hypothetical protein
LLRELDSLIANDRYFLSPRIQTLEAIRTKLCPEPVREPLPPRRHYEPPRATVADAVAVTRGRIRFYNREGVAGSPKNGSTFF